VKINVELCIECGKFNSEAEEEALHSKRRVHVVHVVRSIVTQVGTELRINLAIPHSIIPTGNR
jgi:hypothetical protein